MLGNKDLFTTYLIPNQLGVGSPKGAETCVHSVRSYLQDPSSIGKVLVKIDLKNAFNTIRRDKILNLVKTKMESMYNSINQCYTSDTNIIFGERMLKSSKGSSKGTS